jgi:hypothetical protein
VIARAAARRHPATLRIRAPVACPASKALTYTFKGAMPKAADVFDASSLPPAAERKAD